MRCICGHLEGAHHEPARPDDWRCVGVYGRHNCPCEGYEVPAQLGDRLVFGVSRLPREAAETAPAWPPVTG